MATAPSQPPKPRRSRGRPRLEDVADMENRLLEVALREFLANGYGGTSIATIVRAAGISKTTLYSRFPSKESLFRAIMDRQVTRLAAGRLLLSDKNRDLVAGLTAYAKHAMEFSLNGDQLAVNRLIYSESERFPELGRLSAENTAIGIGHLAEFIAQCARADGLPCKDPQAVAELFVFMLRGWYGNVMLTNSKVTKAETARWLTASIRVLVSSRSEW